MRRSVGSCIHTRAFEETGSAVSKSVLVSHEDDGRSMDGKAMKKESAAGEIDAGYVECIEEYRGQKKDLVYGVAGLLDSFGNEQQNGMAEQLLPNPNDNGVELYTLGEVVMLFEERKTMMRQQTEIWVERNGFYKL